MAAFLLGLGIAVGVIFCKEKKISIFNVLTVATSLLLFVYMLFHMEYASVILVLELAIYGLWRFVQWGKRSTISFKRLDEE